MSSEHKLIFPDWPLLKPSLEKIPYYERRRWLMGSISIICFPAFYWIFGFFDPQPYENLPLRLVGSFISLILMFSNLWPKSARRYLAIAWYLVFIFALPFFHTFMLLKNGGDQIWMQSLLGALMVMVLLFDWFMLLLQLLIGVGLAVVAVLMTSDTAVLFSVPPAYITSFSFFVLLGSAANYVNEASRAEKELKDKNDVLEDLVKARTQELEVALHSAAAGNRAKSQFLANISHELRTPINGIVGVFSILQETKLDDQQSELTHMANDCAMGLMRILGDILDYTAIGDGKAPVETSTVELRPLLTDVGNLFLTTASAKSLGLSISIDSSVPLTIVVDRLRLEQVLIKLLDNAFKFTEHGKIALTVTKSVPDNHVKLSISDTGLGIPNDKQQELFLPFHQVDGSLTRKHGGTGLSLALCKRLIVLMGGEIGIDSVEGQGTSVWFTVPVNQTST